MIISRTPLRISFAGGGSDLPCFYTKEAGAVVGTAINKYIYITVNKKFDNRIRASYSITEFVDQPRELKHELIREALGLLGIDGGIEITSISDIPSTGTGLGSSSTYTVGLLNALYAFQGRWVSPEKIAAEACQIEIDKCRKPIGKQDQYLAAYGGFNYLQFDPDGKVRVEPIICRKETRDRIQNNLLLLYTGVTRSADKILKVQKRETAKDGKKKKILRQMVGLARDLKTALEENRPDTFGEILDANWELKKKMAQGISNERINDWYRTVKRNGATGGKILGAGGGGFLLVYAPRENHNRICDSLPELKRVEFAFETEGSKIIYFGEK
jgi:D-glycero-alpha-D-manno-heptose-7-phosphate kinase